MERMRVQEVGNPQTRTPPDFRLAPGLAYLTKTYQIAAGAQLPLNYCANTQDKIAVLARLDLFYDRLFPGIPKGLF